MRSKRITTIILLSGFFLSLAASQALSQTPEEISEEWIHHHGHTILAEYAELLRIPNHASDLENIRRNAERIRQMFAPRGFDMQLLEIDGAPPIVFGKRTVEGADRTIALYVHYDGQPVDPEKWVHDPFDPVLYSDAMYKGGEPISYPEAGDEIDDDWRIYARSASDDKAPLIALSAALDALNSAGVELTSNVILFFDGEEESSSPHIQQYLETYGELLEEIDVWLMLDGAVYPTGAPRFSFGSRGVTDMQLTVYGATRPLHSGHYGNWAPVPGQMLARLLTSMKDEDGKILIDGFYDSIEPISEYEMEQINNAPNIDDLLKEDLGLASTEGAGETLQETLLRPSLTVKGLASGSVSEKTRNIIPHTAIAELGIRMVKGNDPEEMMNHVERHIRGQGWLLVREDPDHQTRLEHPKIVKVVRGKNGFPASKTSMENPMILTIIDGIKRVTDGEAVFLPGTGASNRIYGMIFEGLGKPGVSMTMVNPDNNQHAENENVRIGNLWLGTKMLSAILTVPE